MAAKLRPPERVSCCIMQELLDDALAHFSEGKPVKAMLLQADRCAWEQVHCTPRTELFAGTKQRTSYQAFARAVVQCDLQIL